MNMRSSVVIVATLVLAAAGCRSGSPFEEKQMALSQEPVTLPDAEEIRRRCEEQIPVGLPIVDAEDIMTANGFKCSDERDELGTYLSCHRPKSVRSRSEIPWHVAVRYRDAKVTDIQVSRGTSTQMAISSETNP